MTPYRFRNIARRAIASLPEALRPYADECMMTVRRQPSKKLRRELGLKPNDVLFGLYQGTLVGGRRYHAVMPPRIILFYDALVEACRTDDQLEREIRRTVLHEIGHHFGMDEDQLDELGY